MHADWERERDTAIHSTINIKKQKTKFRFSPWPRAKLSINYAQNFKSYQNGLLE